MIDTKRIKRNLEERNLRIRKLQNIFITILTEARKDKSLLNKGWIILYFMYT